MKKVLLLALMLALIAGVGVAFSANSGGVSGPAVWGGGHFVFPGTSVSRDFSVNARPGSGDFIYGRVGIGSAVGPLTVTCVDVSGNRAVIAGYITEGENAGAPWTGTPYTWYAIDNGSPRASQVLDQASPVFLGFTADELSAMPAGFPHVCPDAGNPPSYVTFSDVTAGDVVVRAAGSN